MKGRIIFLLEEPSMKELLVRLIPRLFPGLCEQQHFLCIHHEGKSDLDKSIPTKLSAWREPDVRFVIVRDNDGADCFAQKTRIQNLCQQAGRPDTLVRLVCQELEGWYLGDLQALAKAFAEPKIDTEKHRKRFSNPDSWLKPSTELTRLAQGFQKRSGARAMALHLSYENNRSHSYRVFISGLKTLLQEMEYTPQ